MKKGFTAVFIWILGIVSAQQWEEVRSVFFDYDKYNLKADQAFEIEDVFRTVDTTRIETIEIFGFCDDRGKDDYNYILSEKRASTVKEKLVEMGIRNKFIVHIEGKGRVLLHENLIDTEIDAERQKNRRVDVILNFKSITVEELNLPNVYSNISKNVQEGDRIILDRIFFDKNSSKLTTRAKKELDRIVKQLHRYPNVEFEIQGHVCCTPSYYDDALDRDTKKRELSKMRAQNVFRYFIASKISAKRMIYKGYGNTLPLGKGPQIDRRVELVITKI